ncbi:hypothetical protein C1646_697596 [Rhizophagus diaphanus]|nr:hypothetical protein C1646_697596 [Rhizophagus diaphanus] [Rhizophagus sp. MUCL 43196]
MSITLLCLVKGNKTSNAFAVDIDREKLVSHLKKVIKAEKQNDFAGIDAEKLRLWKKEIPDDQDDLLSNLTLNDGDELLATKMISKYFPDSPPEEHIHVLVSPPETTATSSEVLELREQLALLQALLNKSTHGTRVSFDG